MSKAQHPIRLFETVVDQCPYLEEQQSASILIDPDHEVSLDLFSMLSHSGFRRSGEMLYAPKCPDCSACISVRIPSDEFKPSRSQKRVWRANLDLEMRVEDVCFKQEHFDLYLKYQKARHPDSSMCDEDVEKYTAFIDAYYSNSRFLCFYKKSKGKESELICISVIDQFHGGISAVYTFFDPEESQRSLGTYAILTMLRMAEKRKIPYVYLGYWIEQASKMSYKRKFKPLQGYIGRKWINITD